MWSLNVCKCLETSKIKNTTSKTSLLFTHFLHNFYSSHTKKQKQKKAQLEYGNKLYLLIMRQKVCFSSVFLSCFQYAVFFITVSEYLPTSTER